MTETGFKLDFDPDKMEHEGEPHGVSLRQIKESPHIDDGYRNLCLEIYIRQRGLISNTLGCIELAYRRGYQAGKEDAEKGG